MYMSCDVQPSPHGTKLVRAASQCERFVLRDPRGPKAKDKVRRTETEQSRHRAQSVGEGGEAGDRRSATADSNPFSTPVGWRMMSRLEREQSDVNAKTERRVKIRTREGGDRYHKERGQSFRERIMVRFQTRAARRA